MKTFRISYEIPWKPKGPKTIVSRLISAKNIYSALKKFKDQYPKHSDHIIKVVQTRY